MQESDDRSFSILVPHKLKKYSRKTLSELGELTLISYQSEDPDQFGNHYSLSYIDYPVNAFDDHPGLAAELAETTVEGLPGETVYEELIKGEKYNILLSRKKLSEQNLYSKSKVFVINYRVYIMMVYASAERGINDGIDSFLDSFTVL